MSVPRPNDGDGRTDIAVFRDGTWHVLQSSDNGYRAQQWGMAGDKPVPGDYDGDRKVDIAVFRASERTWFLPHTTPRVSQPLS